MKTSNKLKKWHNSPIMTTEGAYKKGGRKVGYIRQTNYFDIIPPQDIEITGTPSRTLSTFWNNDILPTTIKIRQIYLPNYQESDAVVLESLWKWMKSDAKNEELVKNISPTAPKSCEALPVEAILNRKTLFFFTMHNDFKRPPKTAVIEPFVAFKPGTIDWENDIRNNTFLTFRTYSERPLEVHEPKPKSAPNPINSYLLKKGISRDLIESYEGVNAISWVLLMKYHLELLRREKYILSG